VTQAVEMTRERCALLNDFTTQAGFLFATPALYDIASIQPKWDEKKQNFFKAFVVELSKISEWNAPTIEAKFKKLAAEQGVKPGDCMLPLRVMLVGGKFGPGVFDIAAFIGAAATKERIEQVMALLG
jgi:glutamyl-tRNA synthetase